MSDARTGKRFPLELPVTIHSTETNQDVKGFTSNLSAAGVYVRAEGPLEVGSQIEFQIALPAEVTGGSSPVLLQCKGRVVRSDGPGDGGQGVACVIDSYEMVRNA